MANIERNASVAHTNLASPKVSLPTRVLNMEALLNTISTPAQNSAQELEHTNCIKKITELTLEIDTNLPGVGALKLTCFHFDINF